MSNPSWRQFAAIPFDATVAAVVKALDLEIPDMGEPLRWPIGWMGLAPMADTTRDTAAAMLTSCR